MLLPFCTILHSLKVWSGLVKSTLGFIQKMSSCASMTAAQGLKQGNDPPKLYTYDKYIT